MKKVLQNQKVIMILVVILSLLGINQVISADNDPGKITLTKNATKISDNFEENNPEYGRLANVTLKVEANPYTEQETTMDKLDIILVLDSSGSMDYTDDGKKTTDDSKKRITSLKSTAKDFVDTMIGNDDKVQIGIVDYADDVKNTQSLTSNKTRLKTFINNLNADGGTNTQSGIVKADELLDNGRSDARKLVVILTDGLPTYFTYDNKTYGTGNSDAEVGYDKCLNYNWWGECTNWNKNQRPSDAAKKALDDLKASHTTTDVYTITFGNAAGAAEKLAKINPASSEGAKPVYKNVTALNAEDLKKEFQNIQDATRNLIGKNSEVVDIVPKEFKLTEDAKKDLETKGVKVVENEDGTTTIRWILGDIEAGEAKAKTLSFDVIAKDEFHGSMYTNQTENYESATLNTTLVAGNPYYKNDKDKNETLKFGSPVVNIPAITNDDHYKDNPSYIGTAQTPIKGTTILNNDLDKITKNDKEKAETIITVKDSIIIEENKNTVKISDNQYQLKDNDGKLLGTLIMHEDGTFHFTAEENVTGEVNFDYHIKTTVTKNGKEEYVYSNTSTVTLNILERTKTEVIGTKTWNDANNQDGLRPESITVKLLANGKVESTQTVNAENSWTYSFNNLYKYEAGHENDEKHIIKYTIEEVKVTGYTTIIDGTNIINTHTPEVIEIEGTKTWNDNNNQDGIRPNSITVNIFADGEKITSQEVTKNNDWKYVFSNLPKYKDGKVITYTVTEETVEGYTAKVTDYNITNTHTPEVTNVTGTKTWIDNNNQDGKRPESITVNLYANGKKVDSKTVTEKENWTYTFDNLAKYSNGEEIKYTVTENEVEYYTTEVTGYDITNTHTPETTVVTGTKTWNDNNNQDGIRPESITVNLFANGQKIDSKTVTADNNWNYEFNDLPKYKDGKVIEYTITETVINGYTAEINGYNIKNTHIPDLYNEDGNYIVTKIWDDKDNQDGIRGSYTVTLTGYVEGEEVYQNSKTLTKDQTNYTWKNLQKYYNGKVIEYTVDETEVPVGYTKSVNGNVITNTHISDLYNEDGKYTVTKVWNDNNDQDGIRENYTVTLTGSVEGEKVYEDSQTLTKDQTTYTWENLQKYYNGKVIEYNVDETEVPTGYTKSINGNVITNTHIPQTIDLTGTKTWNDNTNQDGIRPDSITVNLFADGEKITSQEVTKNNNWKYVFNNLPKYQNGKKIAYTITEDAVEGYETTINELNITNTHKPETTKVSGTKTWNDNNNQDGVRPESITVNLFANGEKVASKVVTADDNWTYTFDNLDKYSNGEEIEYTVREDNVDNYTSKVSGFDITNTHTPETTSITGIKTWNDNNNQDGIRPANITVRLFANGTFVKNAIITKNTNWTYEFNNLPLNENGKKIAYTITEDAVEGYTTAINGYDIENTHIPETTSVTGTKTWNDNNNQDGIRPENITVNLLANGKIVDSKVVTEKDNWKYTFANLDKYSNGEEITYTVKEENVDNYTSKIEGYNITNTHTPETIDLTGTKTWNDNNNQDGIRPASITINLLANGKFVDSKVVTEKDNWTYTFNDLSKYENGKEIAYTVTEDTVDGYSAEINGLNITNTHKPIKIDITGQKVWVDENNIEGLRPNEITVRLFANGKEVSSTTVTADNDWTYTFTNLDKFANGQEIDYTVEEDAVEHYDMSIDKDNKFVIVNTHNPKNVEVTGTKTWIDEDNRYGRPDHITVKLTGKVGDKVVVEETKDVTSEDNWSYSFTDLPEYREGMLITYTIDEEDVKDYTKSINGYDITNTYTPETINISGTKTWNDADNQDGIRPDNITINLLANGEVVAETTATAETNWNFEFKDQVKYANGQEINYTVEEVSVDGYTTEVEGFNVTNNHTPATVSYTVTKVWNDNNNNDNIRPENITVRLIADGIEVATQVIDEANNWTYSFPDLPKYRDGGIEIKYEIIEDEVKGYEASYTPSVSETDPNQNNVIITNTHENEKNEITINKIWDDSDNPSRPNSIKVIIYADGEEVRVIELTKDMNWTYTLTDLDKFKDGKLINYTIEELPVEGYTTTYNGFDIINSMIYGKGGDVEELPPQTGIPASIAPSTNNMNLIYLSLIALFMILTSFKKAEEN